MTIAITARLPGSAVTHLLDVNSPREYAEVNAALEASRIERHGAHHSCIVDFPTREIAEECADRLEDLAEVEEQAAAFGDGADHSIKRACQTGAARIREALS